MEPLSVALWATNIGRPMASLSEWVASVDARMTEAASQGADMLVMPEYAAEQWLSFAPNTLALTQEIRWMAERSSDALEALRPLPERYGIGLLAGTVPVATTTGRDDGPPVVNRAHLMLPDGRLLWQDKLCLTPPERNPDGWHLSTGDEVRLLEWQGWRIAILVCLDIELPALAARLAQHEVDLILVPSMTETLAGYHRVFSCARARATELFAAVCAVGCIGAPSTAKPRVGNTSGASAFLPCEMTPGLDGIAAEISPITNSHDSGPLLIARDLPLGALRRFRRSGAQVWPGPWDAGHVTILDP